MPMLGKLSLRHDGEAFHYLASTASRHAALSWVDRPLQMLERDRHANCPTCLRGADLCFRGKESPVETGEGKGLGEMNLA